MWIHSSEAGCGLPQYGWVEIKSAGKKSSRRSEVIGLLGLRKHERNIVALVAPGVHVNGSKEETKRGVEDQSVLWQGLGKSEARSEVVGISVFKTAWIAVLAANKYRRDAIVKCEICVGVADVHQRIHVFIPETHFNGCVAGKTEAVLGETVRIPLPQLHLRNAGLALFHSRQTEQETRKAGTIVVVDGILSGETISKLIVASVLKKSPHRP